MICDADFVLIFQNSNVFNSVYRFIEVVPYETPLRGNKACIRDAPIQHVLVYEQQNPCNMCIKAGDGKCYALNIGAPCDKGHMNGATKADWVNKARQGFLFDSTKKYLYCQNGKMGYVDILQNTFVPFVANTGVYVFFYRMTQLNENPLPKLNFDKWEDNESDGYLSDDDDDNDYDVISSSSDDDDDLSETEI